jgi:hypothetical protein
MSGWAGQTGGQGRSTSVLAEDFFVYYNYYDSRIYAVGKGPSATTIQAPLTSITKGHSLMIQGTVTDQSPGATGTPAVADESMSTWMEYTYMQQPIPTNVKGVQVKLTAIDPNTNTIDIATVTSDASGMYYYKWTPQLEGTYKITASFKGTESYWPSSAQTAIGVDAAPSAAVQTPIPSAPEITPTAIPTGQVTPSPSSAIPPTSGTSTQIYVALSAVVIIAVAVVAASILRKRK